ANANIGGPAQASWGTPAQGNVAFPTPGAGIPQPPPRTQPGSGGKTGMLLAIAGVVGLLSIGAILFAMKGGSHSNAGGLDLRTDAAPSTDLTQLSAADTGAPSTPDTTEAPIPTLSPPTHVATGPVAHKDAGAKPGATTPGTT